MCVFIYLYMVYTYVCMYMCVYMYVCIHVYIYKCVHALNYDVTLVEKV